MNSLIATLGIIPARGGSKGVPRKNVRLLAGKPLIQYTIEAAQQAGLDRLILTTEDLEIAEIGRKLGIDVPFLRPTHLAEDTTPMLNVLQHAVSQLEENREYYDLICLLQPTNPLRKAEHIIGCLALQHETQADTIMTVLSVPYEYNPHWVFFRQPDDTLYLSTGENVPISRRQDLPPAYHREGSVYIVKRDILIKQGSLYGEKVLGYLMSPEESVNIDGLADFERAEKLIQNCGNYSD